MSWKTDARNGAIAALAVVAAVLIVWPAADLSFNDDWSYAFTVKKLLETGHIVYNGWSSPSVICQSYYGLAWVKAFGFSFAVLRWSMLPLAAASAVMTYLLGRRAGLAGTPALFAALLLAVSPLFLPLATSFMSDVPGLLCMLVSTYGLVRSAETPNRLEAIGWMLAGVAIAAAGGSSRQIVWVVPFALLPLVGWVRVVGKSPHERLAHAGRQSALGTGETPVRRMAGVLEYFPRQVGDLFSGDLLDWLFAVVAVVAWVVAFKSAMTIQHWFERQPYALPEPTFRSEFQSAVHNPGHILSQFLTILLTLAWAVLPAGACLFPGLRKSRRRWLATAGAAAVIGLCLFIRPYYALFPWMGNLITPEGIFGRGQISGGRPTFLPIPVRAAAAALTFAAIAVMLGTGVTTLAGRQSVRRFFAFFLTPPPDRIGPTALVIVTGSYLLLLLTRCALDVAYDRHLMPLIPFAAIPLLAVYQSSSTGPTVRVPWPAWSLLAAFGLFAVVGTQDLLALSRARVIATGRLEAAGIPRTRITAGFEYDYWTELLEAGYINDWRIVNPPDAYKGDIGHALHVHADYRIEATPNSETRPTPFGVVDYFSLLPPFHRTIYIDQYKQPWTPAIAYDRQ